MGIRTLSVIAFVLSIAAVSFGQGTVVLVDPTTAAEQEKMSTSEQKVFDRNALPRFAAKYGSDGCTPEPDVAGAVDGAFTRAGAKQRLVFFQLCQTGNGLGIVGLVVFEGGKVAGMWASDSGWSQAVGVLPDINGNGVDEFTLSYGGGMHQGQGGVGVDVMEFSAGKPKGLGWFKAEEFDEEDATAWKVTAKPGKPPRYFKQKFTQEGENKWRRLGPNAALKLTKAYASFEVVK